MDGQLTLVRLAHLGAAFISIGALLTACTDDGRSGEAAPEPTTVPIEEIELSPADGTLAAVGDMLAVVDGMSTLGDEEPHLRVWFAALDGSADARPYDFEDVGPLSDLGATSLGDDLLIAGQRCPEPFDPNSPSGDTVPGPHDEIEECGSDVTDLVLIDPATGEDRLIHSEGGESSLELFGGGDEAIFQRIAVEGVPRGHGPVLIVSPDGRVEELPTPPERVNTGNPNVICPLNDELLALTELRPDEVFPLAEMFYASRLVEGAWVDAPLPSHEAAVDWVHVETCTASGVLVRASGPPYNEGAPTRLLLELDTTTDPWTWRPGSQDDLPTSGVVRPELGDEVSIDDGRVVVGPPG